MNHPTLRTPRASLTLCAIAAALPLLLAACGGGGGDDDGGTGDDGSVSESTAQAMSADSTTVAYDATEASSAIVTTTETAVAEEAAQASAGGRDASAQATAQAGGEQTVACLGGGSVTFTITGGSLADLANGQLDAGETYALQFDACAESTGAAAIDGAVTLVVTAASGTTLAVETTAEDLTVALPRRTLALSGTSAVSRSVSTSGGTTTEAWGWSTSAITLEHDTIERHSSFTLADVDVQRTLVSTGGVVDSYSFEGTQTLTATLPAGSWHITSATEGAVDFNSDGAPVEGQWTVSTSRNALDVTAGDGTWTVNLDQSADGTIDRTWTWTLDEAMDAAY